MATITNPELDYLNQENIYHEYSNLSDEREEDINKIPTISGDNGHLMPDIEKNIELISRAAKEKRKVLRPIYDFKTKNKSFLEVHMDLKRLGIKNNKFFLILFDRDLQGVDPYSPLLPLNIQVKIAAEIIRNPWYFLREIARIPQDGAPIGPGGGVPFNLDRNSLASWYLFVHNIDHYVSKPRQCGKTQGSLSEIDYAFHFGALSATITFSNKDATNNKMNLYRLKTQRDLLPTFLQMRTMIDLDSGKIIKESNNVTTMRNPVTNNNIQLLPRANSHDAAMSNGRGMTSAISYWDEFDFMPWNTTILQSAAYAYSTARENAIKHGGIACRIFSSTPGDLDSRDGAAASEFIDHMVRWSDDMFDWPISRLEEVIHDSKAKRNGIVYVEHTWKQLKRSQAWYERQCELVSYEQETVMREIDLMRIHGSQLSPFPRDTILYLMANMNPLDNCYRKLDYGYNECYVYLYEPLKRNVPYIIGIDPSDGLANDNNAMTIISPYTLKPVGEMQSPYISQPNFAKMVEKLMDEYCPNAMLVIENNKGRELINCLLLTKYRYRIWYDKKKLLEVDEKVRIHGQQSRDAYIRRAYGYNTNGSSRNLLLSTLETMITENKEVLTGYFLVKDICGLIRKPTTGKVEAGPNNHDDNVISYLLGTTVFRIADNLDEFGLYRGMTENGLLDIKDDRSIVEKMREIAEDAPEELRDLLNQAIRAADPMAEHRQYHKEVTQALRESQPNSSINPNDPFEQIASGDALYDHLIDEAMNTDDYSDQDSFDVMDFI